MAPEMCSVIDYLDRICSQRSSNDSHCWHQQNASSAFRSFQWSVAVSKSRRVFETLSAGELFSVFFVVPFVSSALIAVNLLTLILIRRLRRCGREVGFGSHWPLIVLDVACLLLNLVRFLLTELRVMAYARTHCLGGLLETTLALEGGVFAAFSLDAPLLLGLLLRSWLSHSKGRRLASTSRPVVVLLLALWFLLSWRAHTASVHRAPFGCQLAQTLPASASVAYGSGDYWSLLGVRHVGHKPRAMNCSVEREPWAALAVGLGTLGMGLASVGLSVAARRAFARLRATGALGAKAERRSLVYLVTLSEALLAVSQSAALVTTLVFIGFKDGLKDKPIFGAVSLVAGLSQLLAYLLTFLESFSHFVFAALLSKRFRKELRRFFALRSSLVGVEAQEDLSFHTMHTQPLKRTLPAKAARQLELVVEEL